MGLIECCGCQSVTVFAITTVGGFFFTYLGYWLEAGRLVYALCMLANGGLCLACGCVVERRVVVMKVRSTEPA